MIEFSKPRKFYRIDPDPASLPWTLLNEWRQRDREILDLHWDFIRKHGAVSFFPGHRDNVGNALALYGLIFDANAGLPAGWKKKRIETSSDMAGKVAGWPDKRTAIGKAAMAEIKALPLQPSTNKICDQLGFPHCLQYSGKETVQGICSLGFFETLIVGFLEQTFYCSLPDEALERGRLEAEGYTVKGDPWTPPPGMVEILKEEMDLDFAKAKLAKMVAA